MSAKKRLNGKITKKRNEIVVRHFFARSFPRLPHGMCNYSQAVIIFLVVLFSRANQSCLEETHRSRSRVVWLRIRRCGCRRRTTYRAEGLRLATINRDTRENFAGVPPAYPLMHTHIMHVCIRARANGKLGVLYVTMRNLRVVRRLFAGR